jgi:hypothetical protein
MYLKVIFFVVTFVLTIQKSEAQVFAGYDMFCGLPVVIGQDPQTATARVDQYGNPFIHIDPSVSSNLTLSERFVIAHECGHHILGHSSALGTAQRYMGGTRQQELDADCWAARKLASVGLYADLSVTIMSHASSGHFASQGYPTGLERANNVMACAGASPAASNCRDYSEPCDHPLHPYGDQIACGHLLSAHPQGDVYACQHVCAGQFGPMPCHHNGDVYQCEHTVQQHNYDVIPCSHAMHPSGHTNTVCN